MGTAEGSLATPRCGSSEPGTEAEASRISSTIAVRMAVLSMCMSGQAAQRQLNQDAGEHN